MPDKTTKVLKSFVAKDARIGGDSGNTLCCIPSVMGVKDLYGDVIFPGAFTKALPAFLKRGFNPTSHEWTWEALVGYPTVAYERGNVLYSEFVFHSDQRSQDMLTKCRERLDAGMEVGLSVGFSMVAGQYQQFNSGKDLLAYAKRNGYDLKLFDAKGLSADPEPCAAILEVEDLWEYSLTPTPANQQAMAVAVKSMSAAYGAPVLLSTLGVTKTMPSTKTNGRLRSVCGSRSLDIASRDTSWSASAALKRIKEWAGAQDAPNAKAAKAFMVLSGPNDEWSSYHLPFADVVGGELKAVFKAVSAAAGALDGSRGGVDIPDGDKEGAMRLCEAYYDKAAKEFDDETIKAPWSGDTFEKSGIGAAVPIFRGQFLGANVEYSMCMSSIYEAAYGLLDEYSDALRGAGNFRDMAPDEIEDGLSQSHDEHKDLCMSVFRALRGGNGAETPEEAVESAKRMSLAMMSAGGLGSGLSWLRHAEAAASAARLMVDRASLKADIRAKDNRRLSASDCSVLEGLRANLLKEAAALTDLIAKAAPTGDVETDEETDAILRDVYRSRAEMSRALAA